MHAAGRGTLAGPPAELSIRAIAGGAAGLALVLAGLAWQYARLGVHALRVRHAQPQAGLRALLAETHASVLARNDADLYAAWRLARMNARTALLLVVVALAALTAGGT